jgi:hypothetical protein
MQHIELVAMDALKKSSRYQMFFTELLYAGALTWDNSQTDQMVSPIYRNDIRFLVGVNITCRNTKKKPRIKWCLLVVGPKGVQLNTSRVSRLARFFMFAFIIGMVLGSKKRAKLNWWRQC